MSLGFSSIGEAALAATPDGGARYDASGFSSTAFGTPALIPAAVGSTSTQFGTGVGFNLSQFIDASGFTSTAFGTPSVPFPASGFSSTQFGAPIAALRSSVTSLGAITVFGTPSHPTNQTLTTNGFASIYFGTAFGGRFTPPVVNQSFAASPVATTMFGTAATLSPVSTQAAGSVTATFGSAAAARAQAASALSPVTLFGLPAALSGAHATGVRFTAIGTPIARRTQMAASTYRATRWGVPVCVRSDTYLAGGLNSLARFGQPSASRINAYQASGSVATTLGTPVCAQRYRAFHLPPATRFGKPLLIRNPTC